MKASIASYSNKVFNRILITIEFHCISVKHLSTSIRFNILIVKILICSNQLISLISERKQTKKALKYKEVNQRDEYSIWFRFG